jgi:dTDP-glucose 4,6-dehydratase
MRNFNSILVTGGAGFIGSHVVRRVLRNRPDARIVNLDALTYAGNLENLRDVEGNPNYAFVKGDIQDKDLIARLFSEHGFDAVVHLAAESHVDRSIENPMAFLETNILGTATLLNAAKNAWADAEGDRCFYHISTDEVYGSLGAEGLFTEDTPYDPRSPYSSSKASSDHLVRAWHHTYGLPVVISNCSNNYGPYQHDEKLIPTVIRSIVKGQPIPIYGDGSNVRDWLFVGDHAAAIDLIFHKGQTGQTYCIGGDAERANLELVRTLIALADQHLGNAKGHSESLISFVTDRKGHDFRYAIDHAHLTAALGWTPSTELQEGLRQTVAYYVARYSGGH